MLNVLPYINAWLTVNLDFSSLPPQVLHYLPQDWVMTHADSGYYCTPMRVSSCWIVTDSLWNFKKWCDGCHSISLPEECSGRLIHRENWATDLFCWAGADISVGFGCRIFDFKILNPSVAIPPPCSVIKILPVNLDAVVKISPPPNYLSFFLGVNPAMVHEYRGSLQNGRLGVNTQWLGDRMKGKTLSYWVTFSGLTWTVRKFFWQDAIQYSVNKGFFCSTKKSNQVQLSIFPTRKAW